MAAPGARNDGAVEHIGEIYHGQRGSACVCEQCYGMVRGVWALIRGHRMRVEAIRIAADGAGNPVTDGWGGAAGVHRRGHFNGRQRVAESLCRYHADLESMGTR